MSVTINNKPFEIYSSAGFNAKYGGLEAALYTKEAIQALRKKSVDMLVFEMPDEEHMHIRAAGYDIETGTVLDESSILFETTSLPIDKFWFKIDDYGDKYVGTFLFPSEY